MLVLGIESSCDETAVALVEGGRKVHSSIIASQTKVHAVYGGVVPEIASREHLKVIDPLLHEALAAGGRTLQDVDAIAVTQGPGLIGALLVGIAYAKGLALALGKPLVPVDHVHAHVHGAMLGLGADVVESSFYPTLALVVSGGHTNLYYMKDPISYELIGYSIDDACGESFDKVAKLLGLGYPGGPVIEKLARSGDPRGVPMPRMITQKTRLEFSYSGLKTYMANLIAQEPVPPSGQRLADLCASFQEEALGQIVRKLEAAYKLHPDVKSILVAGGVAANLRFRAMMAEAFRLPSFFPELRYCSDNAAMIAAYGYHLYERQKSENFHDYDWDAYSRYRYPGG